MLKRCYVKLSSVLSILILLMIVLDSNKVIFLTDSRKNSLFNYNKMENKPWVKFESEFFRIIRYILDI